MAHTSSCWASCSADASGMPSTCKSRHKKGFYWRWDTTQFVFLLEARSNLFFYCHLVEVTYNSFYLLLLEVRYNTISFLLAFTGGELQFVFYWRWDTTQFVFTCFYWRWDTTLVFTGGEVQHSLFFTGGEIQHNLFLLAFTGGEIQHWFLLEVRYNTICFLLEVRYNIICFTGGEIQQFIFYWRWGTTQFVFYLLLLAVRYNLFFYWRWDTTICFY